MKSYIRTLFIALLVIYSVQGFVSVVTVFARDAKEFIVYFNSVDEVSYARSLGCTVENVFWGINAALLTCPSGAVNVLRLSGVYIAPNINVSISSTFSSVRILGSLEKVSQAGGTQVNVSVAWSWAVSRVGADLVWRYLHVDGEGSVIAVLDTGIDPTHPLLLGKVAGWIEFDRKGRPVCSSPRDTYGHGTWVASIAAGGDTERYIFGVAPKAKIIAALVLPGGYGSAAQILAGLNWVLNPVDCRGNPLNISRVAVVSMSFGAPNNYTNVFLPAIAKLIEKGIVPVAAIGNEGPYSSANPGNIWGVIGVGATDFNDNIAWFSSYEEVEWPEPPSNWSFKGYYPKTYMKPDVVAPGADVPGAWMGGLIAIGSGTSASTPIVSATAAMVSNILYAKGLRGAKLVEEVYNIITGTAEKLDKAGSGYGLINAFKAVAKTLGFTVNEFTASVYPSRTQPFSTVRVTPRTYELPSQVSVYIAGVEVYRGSIGRSGVEVRVPPTRIAGNEVFIISQSGTSFYFSKALLYIEPVMLLNRFNVSSGESLDIIVSGLGLGDIIVISIGNNMLALDMANLRGSYRASFIAPYIAKSSWFNVTLTDLSTPTVTLSQRIFVYAPRLENVVTQIIINRTETSLSTALLPVVVKVRDYYVSGEEGYIDIALPQNATIVYINVSRVIRGSAKVEIANVTQVSSELYRVWVKTVLVGGDEAEAVIRIGIVFHTKVDGNITKIQQSFEVPILIVSTKPEDRALQNMKITIQRVEEILRKEMQGNISVLESRFTDEINSIKEELNNSKVAVESLTQQISDVSRKIDELSQRVEELKSLTQVQQPPLLLYALTVAAIALSILALVKSWRSR